MTLPEAKTFIIKGVPAELFHQLYFFSATSFCLREWLHFRAETFGGLVVDKIKKKGQRLLSCSCGGEDHFWPGKSGNDGNKKPQSHGGTSFEQGLDSRSVAQNLVILRWQGSFQLCRFIFFVADQRNHWGVMALCPRFKYQARCLSYFGTARARWWGLCVPRLIMTIADQVLQSHESF